MKENYAQLNICLSHIPPKLEEIAPKTPGTGFTQAAQIVEQNKVHINARMILFHAI